MDSYEGPLAVFSHEELTYIQHEMKLSSAKTPDEIGLKASILQKLDRVFSSSPKFRLPHD